MKVMDIYFSHQNSANSPDGGNDWFFEKNNNTKTMIKYYCIHLSSHHPSLCVSLVVNLHTPTIAKMNLHYNERRLLKMFVISVKKKKMITGGSISLFISEMCLLLLWILMWLAVIEWLVLCCETRKKRCLHLLQLSEFLILECKLKHKTRPCYNQYFKTNSL